MRTFLKTVKFLIVDRWQSRGGAHIAVDDSLGRALKESSHVSAGGGASGAAAGRAPGQPQFDQMAKGARNYRKSFDKQERPR